MANSQPTTLESGGKGSGQAIFPLWWGIAACLAIMGVILLLAPYSIHINFVEDKGSSWYFWQLPDPTFWTHFTAWAGYAFHQVTIWGIIYAAQRQNLKYTKGLHPINAIALGTNLFFVALHILQTKIWYDGLAPDVPLASSMGSVILMLVMIMIMEHQRRGLLLGQPVPIPFIKDVGRVLREYHGYYFAWAIIYTFWFHPIETTLGHLVGTLYVLLLLLQGSLFYTRNHLNRWWTLALETIVVIHAVLVALMTADQGIEQAAKFLFAFAAIFIITQMHGVSFKLWQRYTFLLLWIAGVLWFYHDRWELAIRILKAPMMEYTLVLLLTALIWLVFLFPQRLLRRYQKITEENEDIG
ncbi:hypothetical protein [Leptothoe spongobia]|uniref:Serine active site containing 1-like protein n=1 Tax=Leptothoe spongobia TAU-MAC 1115 TaxID=1967444 RepID=A0A947DBW1_9CYAN|nr:hypothetical protein [Leptothoe spongobia]MBT9314073.1 hypothetical protein [Leptothoe spongobia TAU-MAC 1115]